LIFSHILSQKNSPQDVNETLVLMLQSHWEQILSRALSGLSFHSVGDACLQSCSVNQAMPLLILWKKIIKYEIVHLCVDPGKNTKNLNQQSKAVTVLNILKDKPSLLLNILEAGLDHLTFRKVFDIVTTALGPYELMERQHEQSSSLAGSFLEKVLSGMFEYLPKHFKSTGFGGSSCVQAGDGEVQMRDVVLMRKSCLTLLKSAATLNQSGNYHQTDMWRKGCMVA
jgi:hypothetical protein